jgi:predicted RNase H-like nuclease (RuvC/YqgF family)
MDKSQRQEANKAKLNGKLSKVDLLNSSSSGSNDATKKNGGKGSDTLGAKENEYGSDTDKSVEQIRELLQPFLEHSALEEKVSELRKENIQLKSEIRKSNTNAKSLELNLNEKCHELSMNASMLEMAKWEAQCSKTELKEALEAIQKNKMEIQ